MVIRQIDAFGELQAAAHLLRERWTLALPTAIASLCVGLIVVMLLASLVASAVGVSAGAAAGHGLGVAAFLGAGLVSLLVSVVASVLFVGLSQVVVMVAAEDAWQGRQPDYGAAIGRTIGKLPTLIALFILCALLAIIPLALSVVFIGVPLLLVLGFFLMFALPAVVVGNESASGAIRSSFHLVRANLTPSIAAFVAILVVIASGKIIDAAFLHIPLIGLIITFFIGGLTYAYAALVSVRFYDLFRQTTVVP
jgi:hypothetical protein